jgi:small subunit ribosomal protein S8
MIQDTIADMLTRIRNALAVGHVEVSMFSSKMKVAIARILKEEGYIESYRIDNEDSVKKVLVITLKYYNNRPVIERIERISKPSLRVYADSNEMSTKWKVLNGFGIAIISTPLGLLTNRQAFKSKVGGEVICVIQ